MLSLSRKPLHVVALSQSEKLSRAQHYRYVPVYFIYVDKNSRNILVYSEDFYLAGLNSVAVNFSEFRVKLLFCPSLECSC